MAKGGVRRKRASDSWSRGWRFRLYPTPEQELLITAQADAARTMWNCLHACWSMVSENRRVDFDRLGSEIRRARNEVDFLAVLPAQAAQQVQTTYVGAWRKCWDEGTGAPRFKSRKTYRPAFDIPQARDLHLTQTSRKYATVNVSLVGRVRFRNHRPVPDTHRITGARIVRERGHWMLVLRVEIPKTAQPAPLPADRPEVGGDRGVTLPLVLSDGVAFEHTFWDESGEWLTPRGQRRLLLAERKAARQRHHRWVTRGKRSRVGANEAKTYAIVADLRARAARRRYDWQHQVSAHLARTYSGIALENLHTAAMTRSAAGTLDNPGTIASMSEHAAHEKARARLTRIVASAATDAEDCKLLLEVLGLDAADGKTDKARTPMFAEELAILAKSAA